MHVYTTHDYIGLFFLLYIYVYGDFCKTLYYVFLHKIKNNHIRFSMDVTF